MKKGERIKELRERIGKSQTEFADAIGVSKQTLYKYEYSIITNIPSDKIEAIADLCHVSPGYIMGWEFKKGDIVPLEKADPDDMKLLAAYHAAPDGIKEAVKKLLDIERG